MSTKLICDVGGEEIILADDLSPVVTITCVIDGRTVHKSGDADEMHRDELFEILVSGIRQELFPGT